VSSNSVSVIGAVLTGGVGAALGSVITAVVQIMGRKGESRATAADLVTHAAGNLADRLDKMNTVLEERLAISEKQNAQMRQSLTALIEAVEDLLPIVSDDTTRRRVQGAINAARVAFR
jgi:hypothetical protein